MDSNSERPPKLTRRQMTVGSAVATGSVLSRPPLGRFLEAFGKSAVETGKISPHLLPPVADIAWEKTKVILGEEEVYEEPKEGISLPERIELGKRITNWTLPNGQRLSSISPEAARTGQLFTAKNLRGYLPGASGGLSVLLKDISAWGAYSFGAEPNKELESVRLVTTIPGREPAKTPVYQPGLFVIVLPDSTRGTYAELAIAVKEGLHLVEYMEFARFYKKMLEEDYQIKFDIDNPQKLPVSQDVIAFSVAIVQAHVAREREVTPWFSDFLDISAHLRAGAITFANWYLNYPEEHRQVPPGLLQAGQSYAGFLQKEGLIKQQGNVFVWVAGRPPQVNSKEILPLYEKFRQRYPLAAG